MRPQIFYIAGVNLHQHFLGDSEKWWIFQISSKLWHFFKILFYLAKYAIYGLVNLELKSFKLPKEPFSMLRISI